MPVTTETPHVNAWLFAATGADYSYRQRRFWSSDSFAERERRSGVSHEHRDAGNRN